MNNILNKDKILNYIIYLMPVIDALNTIVGTKLSLIIRSLFLLGFVIYFLFFCKSDNKKTLIYMALTIVIFSISYIIYNYFLNGFSNFIGEITSLIKFIYLPILLICLHGYCKDKNINTLNFMINMAYLYALLIVIPTMFGQGLKSYDYYKLGYSGLFYSPNEISNILVILFPFVIFGIFKYKKNILNYAMAILFIISCFVLGTKTPIIGMILSILMCFAICLIKLVLIKKVRKDTLTNIIILFIMSMMIFIIYDNSYLKKNMEMQYNRYDTINKDNNDSLISNNPDDDSIENSNADNTLIDNSENIYFPSLKYEEKIKDSKFLNILFSSRNIYLQKNLNKINNKTIYAKLMGITTGNNNNASELDFFDIYVYYGVFGLIILLGYIIVLLIKMIIKILLNIKKVIENDDTLALFISFLLGLLIALTAGHTLSAPAVSIFIALDMVYLIQKLDIRFKCLNDKKIFICILIFYAIVCAFSIYNLSITKYKFNINIFDGKLTSNNEIVKIEGKNIEYKNMNDELNYYILDDYKNIELIYVKRIIDENNEIYYFTINNKENININVNIEYAYDGKVIYNNKNNLVLTGNSNLIFSNTYQYKMDYNSKDNAKELIKLDYDITNNSNYINKNIVLKSNTSMDAYIIKSNEEIKADALPWLSFNGIYTLSKDNKYIRNIVDKNYIDYGNTLQKIMNDNYLFYLHSYAPFMNEIWYSSYFDNNNLTYELDATLNYNLFRRFEKLGIDLTLINSFSKMIKDEYAKNHYIAINNGIMFNGKFNTSLKEQVSIANILIESYSASKDKKVYEIIEKLLKNITNKNWYKDKNNLYEYVDKDLNYIGEVNDIEVLENCLYLFKNLKKTNLKNKYSVNNAIRILYRKINKSEIDKLNDELKSILKEGGFYE